MKRWLVLVLVALWSLILCPTAHAAPQPSSYLWFTFPNQPKIQGMQLLSCQTPQCQESTLLLKSGTCDDTGCRTETPTLKPPQQFDCSESVCLYREFSDCPKIPYFKLVGQFATGVFTSQPFTSHYRSRLAGYSDRHLIVQTNGQSALIVTPDRQPMKPTRWEWFEEGFALTQVSELAIATLVWIWKSRSLLVTRLTGIAIVNCLTFPVTWFFFPSFEPFQYSVLRIFGVASLMMAIAFSGVLLKLKSVTPKTLVRILTIALLTWIPVLIGSTLVAFFFSYGEILPSSVGVHRIIPIGAAGIFAIGWERWLLHRLNHGVSIWEAAIVSVLMNLTSLGLVQILVPV